MKEKGKLWRICVGFLALDIALALAMGVALGVQRWQGERRQDALAAWLGADRAQSEAERQEIYAQAAGEALAQVSLDNECRAKDGGVRLNFANGSGSAFRVAAELVDLDTGEVIGRVGPVEPNHYVETVELDAALDAGRHFCIARCSFYWMENGAYLGSGAIQLLITVEEERT